MSTSLKRKRRLEFLARKGGLRRCPRGEKEPFDLSPAQVGLVERIVGEESDARRLVVAAMHMGTGKTLAALAALCVLRARNGGHFPIRALFVVPKSTLYNAWKRQLRRFTRLDVNDLRVVTYPRLQNTFLKSWRKNERGEWQRFSRNPLLNNRRDFVVFDESHVLRNPNTVLGRAASLISEKASRVLCLTGTPVHNGPEDASGHLRAMRSGSVLEDPSAFGKRAALRKDAIRAFSERFVYTASLADAGITLRKKHNEITWVDHAFTKDIAEQYNESLLAIQGTVAAPDEDNPVAVRHHMLILRQLCVEPALFHKHGRPTFDKEARRRTVAAPGPKLRAAIACVRRLVYEGHSKIVVVSEFVSLLDVFKDLAREELCEDCLSFDGRLAATARGKLIDEFIEGTCRLMCLSLGAGAYGLNLTPGPTAMVILDVWFNPAVHRQVEARIHRVGQTKEVKIHTLVTRGSVEAAILATHAEKEACATALMTGVHDGETRSVEVKRIAENCHQVEPVVD